MSARFSPKSALMVMGSAFVVTAVNYAAPPGSSLGAGEAIVNTTTAKAQLNPALARDADGDFVVVWQSDVSAAGDGSDYDVYLRRYNHLGVAQGSDVRVNTTTAGIQQAPAVAMDASGNFIVVWDSDQAETPAGSGTGIWGQRYDSAGAPQGGEFQVNTFTTNFQAQPAVAMDADGDFVVAWQSLSQDGSGQGIYAQRFDTTGAAAGAEFAVNTFTASSQTLPSVAMTPAGAFVIAWQSNNQEGAGLLNGIYSQRFEADGTPSGAELRVNATTAGEQKLPSVGLAADGSYVVAWEGPDATGTGIYARVIDATGSPVTGEIAVNTATDGDETAPAVGVDADGDFTVAWHGADTSGTGVYFQRFDATGTAQGAETATSGTTSGSQQDAALATDADGDYVIAWESDQVTLDGFNVYARRYAGPEDVDLYMPMTDSPDPVVAGNNVTYILTVINQHPVETPTGQALVDAAIGSANGIVVTDTLPAAATSASGTGWTCTGVGTTSVSCSYASVLAAGASAPPITIVMATPITPGEITNTATVTANQSDTITNNNSPSQATATCSLSANPGTVQFSGATYSAGEGAATATITATRTSGLCGSVTVNYATSNGTATAGSDYTATSGVLTWAGNDNANKTFTVPVTADAIDEVNETVNLTLSNPDRATLGTQKTAVLTINDDDAVTVSFSAAAQSVAEDVGTVTVTAVRTGATSFAIDIPFTLGGTAAGSDHGAVAGTITIPAASPNATYTFPVTNDALDESDETLILTMGTPAGGNVTTTSPSAHTVTITDNDAVPTVNFNPAAVTLTENNTGMQGVIVTAVLDAVSGRNVTVPFTVSGTATDVGEHTASSGNLTIVAGASSGTYTYNVNGDTRFENDETVVLTMGAPTNAVAGINSVHTTTIEDDDNAPGVTLSIAGTPAAENAGVVTVTATLDAVSGMPTTIQLAFSGTATLTSDYTRSGTSIVIPAGSTTGTATITAVQDTLDEANETVIVDVDSVENGTEILVQQVSATITDDDNAPNVTLTLTDSPLAENGGVATVSATLAAVSAKDTTITLSFTGTAGNPADYTASGATLVIPAGATAPTAPVTLTGVSDAIDEVNETVIVDMACDANCTEATAQQVTATVTDDDAVTVSFAVDQAVAETGTVTVTATRTGKSDFAVSVPFTLGGTASGGSVDHNAVSTNPIVIPASNNATETGTYTFTVNADAKDEADETVIFTMGTPTGGSVTAAAPTSHTVTITDDDAVSVAFSAATQSVGEGGGTVTVTATRTGTTDFAISIPVTVSGTAVNPADHNAASATISIPAAAASGTTTFTVAQDTLDENAETVIYTMGTPAGGTVTTAVPSVQTVTITDDDATPTVQFTAASQDVAEDVAGGTATMTLQLSAASGLDVMVNYSQTAGSATGSDYALSPAAPGPVLIPAGQTSAVITVNVTNDATDEPSETAAITLATPANATLGTTATHTFTILDNDDIPQVSFTTAAQTRAESDGIAQITVQLSRPSSEDINVPFTLGGSADGADYTIDPSPVTIVAGDTTAILNATIADDARDEAAQTLVVTMGTPTNATPTGTTAHTITIGDNDSTTVAFASAGQSVGETGTVTVSVTRSGASDFDLSVPFTVSGSAANPADHNATAGTINIPASGSASASASTSFTVASDAFDEPNETVVFTLGTPGGGDVTAAAPSAHTVTITDDDTPPTVTLSLAGSPLAENGGVATVTATLSAVSAQDVTVNLAYAGTASGADYAASGSSITITAGNLAGSVTIAGVNDAVDEANETVSVAISTVTNGTESGTQQVVATITDDDAVTVAWSTSAQTVSEGVGTALVTLVRTGATDFQVNVPVTVSGTAANPSDHDATSMVISIPPNVSSVTAQVSIVQDTRDEPDETAIGTLGTPTGGNVSLGATTVHTLTIADDDAAPTVTLGASATAMAETGGTATLTATLSAASGRDVTVSLGFGGTAGNPADYTASASSISIPAGSTSGTITLTSASDAADEPNETVVVDVTSVTNGTESGTQVQTVTITDDDATPSSGGGGGGSWSLMGLWMLLPALGRRRRATAR